MFTPPAAEQDLNLPDEAVPDGDRLDAVVPGARREPVLTVYEDEFVVGRDDGQQPLLRHPVGKHRSKNAALSM
ncbi:hypothetical protein ACWGI8_21575 [Streptomyces sp. NPDC054841]